MYHVPTYIEFSPIKVDGLVQCVSGTQSLLSKVSFLYFASSDFEQFFSVNVCSSRFRR